MCYACGPFTRNHTGHFASEDKLSLSTNESHLLNAFGLQGSVPKRGERNLRARLLGRLLNSLLQKLEKYSREINIT